MVTRPTFEVAFDVNPGAVPSSGDWTDLTSRVRESDPVQATLSATQGSASLRLDNRDGDLDPLNESSPYNLVPMRHARLTVEISSTTYAVWQGFIDRWPPDWTHGDSTVTVSMVDARVWLALQDGNVDLAAHRTHTRIGALLDDASWPASLRDINDGVVRLEALEQDGANLLRLIDDAADAEDGVLYVSADGKVTFRSRHWRFEESSSLTVGGANVGFSRARTAFDGDTLVNVGRVELEDGNAYEHEDSSSVTAYGRRVGIVRDLAFPSVEATALAQWLVYRFAEPSFGLPVVELSVYDDTDLVDVLGVAPGDLVTFTHTPVSGSVEVVGQVQSIAHRITYGVWRTSLELAPWFGDGDWMIWNDSGGSQGGPGWDDEGAKWAP